ncbi:MAG: two-component regulator propeller domain-containing protein [Bacteroidota bacterium]
MSIKSFLVWCILFLAQSSLAQQYTPRFETIDVKTGLSQNSIQSIIQDDKGFIWFGTQDGLNRFDGYEFKVFTHDPADSNSIDNNYIASIKKDSLGNLWVGTYKGLNYYDQLQQSFRRFYFDENNLEVLDLALDVNGKVWIATSKGLFTTNAIENPKLTKVNLGQADRQNEAYRSLLVDKRNWLWLVGTGGALVYDINTGEVIDLTEISQDFRNAKSLYYRSYNDVICMGFRQKLLILQPNTVKAFGIQHLQSQLKWQLIHTEEDKDIEILNIYGDNEDQIWMGTAQHGLCVLDRSDNEIVVYNHRNMGMDSPITSNRVNTIYEDYSGNVWFGTMEKGVLKMHKSRTAFELYRKTSGDPNSLSSNRVRGLMQDSNGMFWIATAQGLDVLDRTNNSFKRFNRDARDANSIIDNDIKLVAQDLEGLIWIGTNRGLDRFDPETKRFYHYNVENGKITNNKIRAIFIDENNVKWIGTLGGGLLRIKGEEIRVFQSDSSDPNALGNNNVMAVHDTGKGFMLIGTYGGGVYKFNLESEQFEPYPLTENPTGNVGLISFIHADEDGDIWIGTYGAGVYRIENKTGEKTHFSTSDGLANNVVYGALKSGDYVWLSTNNGLSKLNPTNNSLTNYGIDDGLQSYEFNAKSFLKSSSGELLFGGVNGLNIFHPDNIQDNAVAPQPEITELIIYNRPVGIGEEVLGYAPLAQSISYTDTLYLNHDFNVFGFEFSALHFANASKNTFSYKLDVFDVDWVQTDASNRTATYTNLEPGTYNFMLRATNNDNVWNDDTRTLTIIIRPAFWQLWWFRPLIGLLIIALVGQWYYRWSKTQKRIKRLLEQKVVERTVQLERSNKALEVSKNRLANINERKDTIFHLLSHDLRGPLTRIRGFMDLLRIKDAMDEKDVEFHTRKIESDVNDSLMLLDNTLYWSMLSTDNLEVTTDKVDVSELLESLTSRFKDKLSTKHLKINLDLEVTTVTADQALFRVVLRNLLSNAIKYSHKSSEINICSRENGAMNIISIEDFGIGMDPKDIPRLFDGEYNPSVDGTYNEKGTGIGLNICYNIMQLHGGSISAESTPNEGTRFDVYLPK